MRPFGNNGAAARGQDWRLGSTSTGYMVAGFAVASMIVNIAVLMIYPLYGTIGTVFHVDRTTVNLLALTSAIIGGTAGGIVTAWGSTFGFRKMVITSLACVTVGCFIMALASSFAVFLIGNCFLGAAAGGIYLAGGGVRTFVRSRQLGRYMGIVASLAGLSVFIGFPLFGLVEDVAHVGYAAVLYAFGIVSALGAVFAFVTIPDNTASRKSGGTDYVGMLLLTVAIAALVLPLAEGNSWGWGSPQIWGLLAGGVILTVVWVWYENRIENPLIQLRKMSKPGVAYGILIVLWNTMAVDVINLTGPQFAETPSVAGYGFGTSPLVGGLIMLPFAATLIVSARVSGAVISRVGGNAVTIACFALVGVSGVLLALFHGQLWELCVFTGIFGLGYNAGYTASYYVTHAEIDDEDAGGGASLLATTGRVAGSLGIAIVTLAMSGGTVQVAGVAFPTAGGYALSWWLMAAMGAAGLLTVAALGSRSRGGRPIPAERPAMQAALSADQPGLA